MYTLPKTPFHIAFDRNTSSFLWTELINTWHFIEDQASLFMLGFLEGRLVLYKRDEPKLGAIYVDFVEGGLNHRRQFGGGRGEAIVKACGLKGNDIMTIIDATAGLGKDAFVLASVGFHVTLLERHPVVAALLADGLQRAYQDPLIGSWMKERMRQVLPNDSQRDSQLRLLSMPMHDVVYLDPMYPHPENKKKSALVKKEMRVFQSLVGQDLDADGLLEPALIIARKRVVVKRPDFAPYLNNKPADGAIKTKNHRFDIYSTLIKPKE